MSDRSNIEWTDATWNPTRGCSRVSAGCENCYAERQAIRHAGPGGAFEGLVRSTPSGPRWTRAVRIVPEVLETPARWRKPRRIFVDSMSDLFHEDVPDEFIARVFNVMARCDRHQFQILTKRPARMLAWLRSCRQSEFNGWVTLNGAPPRSSGGDATVVGFGRWPLSNVWLGVSVEHQAAADERIPLLLQAPAVVRFLSCEPLLGPLDLGAWVRRVDADGDCTVCGLSALEDLKAFGSHECPAGFGPRLDWIIAGGESGPGARPMHPDWARALRDQCAGARLPFFFKQWGEWVPEAEAASIVLGPLPAWAGARVQAHGLDFVRVGKGAAGRVLDGREHAGFPA